MLAKKYKIRGRLAIQRVFQKGSKLRLPSVRFCSIRYLQKGGADNISSFSVIVPTALKLNAVRRNRLRRRVYEAIRKNFALTKGKKYDIVIVVHQSLDTYSFADIEKNLSQLLQKLP